ncbi:hypothetical protein L3Q82_021164 [Scortum barcoo]|uniref:Uncharacterized protein n=1 Tax=Scortum barcoo TaxID=214431 RepID=A0ACB8X4B2_9TELE|nr:hypothetical protein L3Q82_021164 [Scortum barcoo]
MGDPTRGIMDLFGHTNPSTTDHAQPLLLIGSDMPHLLTPIEPVQTGPLGGPIAVHTKLGWSLQGPTNIDQVPASEQQCLFTVTDSPTCELFKNVERLNGRLIHCPIQARSRYATPLLRRANSATLQAPMEMVLSSLRSTERRLAKDPQHTEVYCQEIKKLGRRMGYVAVVPPEVHHCWESSFRFRQYPVAVSGDIKAMFHQVRLLPADKPVLRFIWWDMKRTEEPKIYEWQVLPFGTTCSPCCAIYALQQHVQNASESNSDLIDIVEQSFYVDNCLHSTHSKEEAKDVVDRLRQLLHTGGFEIRQWASNVPAVNEDLPSDVRSESSELWLSQHSADLQEPTLGLRWDCLHDSLKYKHRPVERTEPMLRNVYKVLACQYDPLGYIVPFTTRAKIQDLWKEQLGWDDPMTRSSHRASVTDGSPGNERFLISSK